MKDDEIVRLFFDRNEIAIAESKKEYGKYCLYIAQNLLHDFSDSEECVNDVMLAAWNSIPPQRPANLRTYLGKLTRETAVDSLRKRDAQKRFIYGEPSSFEELEDVIGNSDVESYVNASELSRSISVFLRSLREEERNIFIRRYWYCDSVKSICARFGCGKSKVTVTLKRTRDKLARYLKEEGYVL